MSTAQADIQRLARDCAEESLGCWLTFLFDFAQEAACVWIYRCDADAQLASQRGARAVFVAEFVKHLEELRDEREADVEFDDWEEVRDVRAERLIAYGARAC